MHVQQEFFLLKRNGLWSLALVRNEVGIRVLWSPGWNEAEVDQAIDWLLFRLDGLAACSEWEWNEIPPSVSPEWLEEYEFPIRTSASDAVGLFAECVPYAESESMLLSRPPGSPLGRADGGEPPAPAAD